MKVAEYLAASGRSPFAEWFATLDSNAAAKITVALARVERGNVGVLKSVGSGVLEYRIDWGPGYRIYVGRDGDELVILLGGGSKRRQQDDVEAAHERWRDYKHRKRNE